MAISPWQWANLGAAGAQGAYGGAQQGGGGALKGGLMGAGTAALGMVPYVGGALSGLAGGAQSGMGSNINVGGERVGVPDQLQKGNQMLSGAAIGATAAIPVAGPFVAGGLSIAKALSDKSQAKKLQKKAGKAVQSQQYTQATQARNRRTATAPTATPVGVQSGGGRGTGALAKMALQRGAGGVGQQFGPGAQPGPAGMSPMQASTQTGRAGQQFTPTGLGGGAAPQGGSNFSAPAAGATRAGGGNPNYNPGGHGLGAAMQAGLQGGGGQGGGVLGGWGAAGPQGVPSYAQNQYGTNQAAARGMQGGPRGGNLRDYTSRVLAEQIQRGMDPRILQGLQNSAIGSAAGARQTMNDAFARSGDNSGYNTGMQGGMDMALQNQLAQVAPEYYGKAQDYLNDLIFKFRGTMKGAPGAPQQAGTDWGSIMGGIANLGQAAGNVYQNVRTPAATPSSWNAGTTQMV